MKLKGIELKGTYKVKFDDKWFEVYDKKGNMIYYEAGDDWVKREYDEKGNFIYGENSHGYSEKREYDKNGNMSYYEDSNGEFFDKRLKEITIEELEKLGYKLKESEL